MKTPLTKYRVQFFTSDEHATVLFFNREEDAQFAYYSIPPTMQEVRRTAHEVEFYIDGEGNTGVTQGDLLGSGPPPIGGNHYDERF